MIIYNYKLIYLLPIALITGSFIPDLIVVTCSLLFLVDTFRNKYFIYYDNNFFKVFSLFFLLLVVSSSLSGELLSFKYSLGYIRYGIFSIFIFYVLKNFKNVKFNFSIILILIFIFLIIDGFIQLLFGKNILLFELQSYNHKLAYVTSVFDEEKKLGSYLARLFPIFLMSIILFNKEFPKKKLEKYFSILIFLPFILIIFTTERVSISIVTFFLLLVLFKSNIFFKSKKTHFLIISSLFILLTYYNPLLYEKFMSILYSSGLVFPGWTQNGQVIGEYDIGLFFFSKFHHDQIFNAINTFKDNIFFGVGPRSFRNIYSLHPHNFHAQVLSEAGMFAYSVLFFLFIFLFYKLNKIIFFTKLTNNHDEIKFFLIISFFISLIPIPSGDFFNNWLNIIIYLPVGFYLYYNDKKI